MIAAVMAAAAAVAAAGRPAHRPPTGQVVPSPASRWRRPSLLSPVVVRGVCVLAGVCLGAAATGPTGRLAGVVVGAAAAAVVPRLIARAEAPDIARARTAITADLPWVLEMLSAAIRAGTPAAQAIAAVGAAAGGELGRRLTLVHGRLVVGLPPDEAWREASVGGGDALLGVGEAFVAAAIDGSRLAERLAEQARDARATAAAAVAAGAQRVGVRAVLPLGLCFLPAFVAVGVVPVVAAALGQLH
ncbi:MAG TPA: type II secretion system F family protein [Mycobacteriales bacterium]